MERSRAFPRSDDDAERVARLELMGLLEPLGGEGLADLTQLCRAVFGTPINLLNIVGADEVVMRCADGVPRQSVDRAASVCNWTILAEGILEVPDTDLDRRFADFQSLRDLGIRYYAGVPLTVGGARVGTLCIHDHVPRPPMSPQSREILASFGRIAERYLAMEGQLRASLEPD